ncbi:MAG TPA: helix-turn-helix domain-containing protein, partial [Candidatus Hypogeohydataceae bacterium YC38]
MHIVEISGERIKTLLEARGLSQRELALSLGFSPGYVSDILRGRT